MTDVDPHQPERPLRFRYHLLTLAASLSLCACGSGSSDSAATSPPSRWKVLRDAAAPELVLTSVFATPAPQPIAVDGWEDGIYISRDGLHLFAVYAPCDLLSFTLNGADQNLVADYLRGPTFGMDLVSSPAATAQWIHGDILHATRTNLNMPFSPWALSAFARPIFSEGAVVAQQPSGGTWDLFAYTSNDHAPDYKAHICLLRSVAADPASAAAVFLPAPVTTSTTEDNPHIERLDATNLVLFFDSDDRPGGSGLHDLWFTTSTDDGVTWATPAPVTSLNSTVEEEQPHLYYSSTHTWWMYYTATNPADGKLAIYRSAQGTVNDWNSWGIPELVIGAGNTAGVGEPTLTADGDLSFVVVIEDTTQGTSTNRYDADPWFTPHLPAVVVENGTPIPRADRRLPVHSALAACVP
jgi:hypothetical protein